MVRITAPLEVSCEYYNDLSALSLPEPMVNIPSMLPAAYLPPPPCKYRVNANEHLPLSEFFCMAN